MNKPLRSLSAATAALSVLAISSAALAMDGTITVDGKKPVTDKFVGMKYEIKAPRDVATGQASGKRQYSSLCITKNASAATVQFFQMLITNEALKSITVEITNGHKLKLLQVTVSTLTLQGQDGKDLEEICFTADKVEWSFGKGGTPVFDDIRAGAAK